MPQLQLSLLGCFHVDLQGKPVTDFESDKARALLAYLVIESDRAHRRKELSYLFWTDYPEAQAMKNLRQTLYRLQRTFPDDVDGACTLLIVTPQEVRLNPAYGLDSDLNSFRRLIAEVEAHDRRRVEGCPVCLQKLEQAVELYRGDVLPGFSLRGSPAFDDWLLSLRIALRDQALFALRALGSAAERQGRYKDACRYARGQIELVPTHEEAYCELMRSLAHDGQRSAALTQYKTLKRSLHAELSIDPAAETTALFHQIRQGLPLSAPPDVLLRKFPALGTPFIGREAELATMMDYLSSSRCRLLTLIGPGGVGKTRLAIEAAARIGPLFAQGAGFIALQPFAALEEVYLEIAEVLGISLQSTRPLRQQLLNHLSGAGELLLVLDNCEHLSLAELVRDMIQAAPRLVILATSRTRLDLQAEWLLPLQGLSYPDSEIEEQVDDAAVRLFVQRAMQAQRDLACSPEVARICRLVEGLPLGIELAAAWVGSIPLAQIAAEIEQHLDFLTSSSSDIPERHRSLRAVFEHSWKLLSEDERTALMRVSVFRGGFQAAAAQSVAGAGVDALTRLVNKSLIYLEGSRYQLHETIRRYAEEKLEEQPDQAQQTRARHAGFFAEFLHQREVDLRSKRQIQAQTEIGSEMQNVRTAWLWAVSQGDEGLLHRLMHGLYLYYEARSWFDEGARVFQQAIDVVRSLAGEQSTAKRLLASLLSRQAVFFRQLSQCGQAEERIAEAYCLLAGTPPDDEQAFLLYQSAWIAFLQANYALTKKLAEKSLKIYRACGDPVGTGDALYVLGWTAYEMGSFSKAEALCREAIAVCEQADYAWGVHYAVYGLGLVQRAQGRYAESQQSFCRVLQFCEQVDFQWGAALARINLAQVALTRGDTQEAGLLYKQSLQVCEQIGNPWGIAQSYKGLAKVALECSDISQAQELAQRSLQLYRQMQDRDGMADCLLILSQAANETGAPAAALDYVQRAEELIHATGNRFRMAYVWYHRAVLLRQAGKTGHAVKLLKKIIECPACDRYTYDKAVAEMEKCGGTTSPLFRQ